LVCCSGINHALATYWCGASGRRFGCGEWTVHLPDKCLGAASSSVIMGLTLVGSTGNPDSIPLLGRRVPAPTLSASCV
jgi:hypothetical protein